MTPRKFYTLFDVHARIHGGKNDGNNGAGSSGNGGAAGWEKGERIAYIDEVL